MQTTRRLLLGLSLVAVSANAAAAATGGFQRHVACAGGLFRDDGLASVEIRSSWPSAWGHVRYTVPCGYYGHVGINEDVYDGPCPPVTYRPAGHWRRLHRRHARR